MKILLLSKYSSLGASSRLRSFQYIPFLKKNNLDITINSLFSDEYLNTLYKKGKRFSFNTFKCYIKRLFIFFSFYKYDLIWIEYEIFPYFPSFFEKILNLFGKKYIVDYDDAIFHNYDNSKNIFIKKILKNKIKNVMKLSSHVISGNKYIKKYADSAGAKNVTIIPTVVDTNRYNKKINYKNNKLIIGWIGSPSTQDFIKEIYKPLLKISKIYNIKIILIGANEKIINELPGLNVKTLPWSEENEVKYIQEMDIGIMPLSDGLWEKGKCGYKLIQYMACAVPIIASPIGANTDIVQYSQGGLLADSPLEWEISLQKLLNCAQLRKKFGEAGRNAVENHYSLKVQAPILAEILIKSINQKP